MSASKLEDVANTPVGRLVARTTARVDVNDPMWKVLQVMDEARRGAAVVEEEGRLVGIFTERDVMTRLEHSDLDWLHVKVADVMTPHPMVIHIDDSVAEAIRRLHEGRRRHLPVVDGTGKAQSLLSIRDLLMYIAQRFPEDFVNLPPRPSRESSGPWGG